MKKEMDKKTDWLAWVLHAGLGIIFGSIAGYAATHKYSQPTWLPNGLIAIFTCGCALVAAGFASLLGDKWWLGKAQGSIAPNEVRSGIAGRILSWLLLVAGITLISLALVHYFAK
jgi:predicted signal transduction protein with EAL and GGDEF domain